MKRRHIPSSHSAHPNVTPLIDVVMVLIVFFMLVAKIGIKSGADATITIPKSILGVNIKDMGNTLLLNVTGPNPNNPNDPPMITALIKGTMQELKTYDTATKKNQLVETLKYFRNGDKAAGIPPNDQFKVIIRAGESLEYRYLEPVLVACAEAKVKEYAFNTGIVTNQTP
jgi:biopolymer transport protein ExbD